LAERRLQRDIAQRHGRGEPGVQKDACQHGGGETRNPANQSEVSQGDASVGGSANAVLGHLCLIRPGAEAAPVIIEQVPCRAGKAFALHGPVAVSFALVVERSVRCFFVYPLRPVLKNSPRHALHAVLTAGGLAIIDVVGGFLREACRARLKIVGALGRE
jgi:hypothetical protein